MQVRLGQYLWGGRELTFIYQDISSECLKLVCEKMESVHIKLWTYTPEETIKIQKWLLLGSRTAIFFYKPFTTIWLFNNAYVLLW